MSQDVLNLLYGLLTLLGQLGLLVAWVSWLLRNRTPWWNTLRDLFGPSGFTLAAIVAAVTMLGSLQLSLGAGYTPCTLCWYQRIAIYPQLVICGVAAWRRDLAVRPTVWILAGIGSAISIYHYVHERFPNAFSSGCDATAPCSIVWIWKFHYISIPMMALTSSLLIATAVALVRPADSESGSDDAEPDPAATEAQA